MKPEAILSRAPIAITQAQREFYFENGYLVLEKFIPDEWLERLWTVTNRFIDESRSLTGSNEKFDVEAGHTAENPRLRRLTQPVEHDPVYWEFACKSPLTDLAEDLLGPDLLFHHAKLNFKWSGGGEEVKWHQDIPFWPHTNDSVMTMGLYLEDVYDVMGPLGVIPGSHRGETYDHYNSNDEWVGALSDADHAKADPEKNAVYLPGPAGSVTVHHCRTLHGSRPNMHPTRSRPLLLNAMSSADALPITPNPTPSTHNRELVRGRPARHAHMEPYPGRLPPDWSGGYSSIFALQQEEDGANAGVRQPKM
ncbi:MAG: phytanoyl-CoA dioxygenase family protein [Alphaproteobacteria bacterium]|jgi:ectoine hydroxylase|nr:phytanoyl-CoA dioxygenase family protein [Alphaproteobacteria bacterium]